MSGKAGNKSIKKIKDELARKAKMENEFNKREQEREKEILRLNPYKTYIPFFKYIRAHKSKIMDRNVINIIFSFK